MGVLRGMAALIGTSLAGAGQHSLQSPPGIQSCPPVCMPEAGTPLLQMYESYLRALLNDELPTLTFKVDKHFYRGPKVGVGAVLAPSALSCLQHVVHAEQGSAWSVPCTASPSAQRRIAALPV